MSRGVGGSAAAPNAYGFDFLRAEHALEGEGRVQPTSSSTAALVPGVASSQLPAFDSLVAHKPDLEKQSDVIHFLKAHRSAGYLAPSVIYKATGIDLQERDESVARMLERHANVKIEHIPDPENPSLAIATYIYQAKYDHVRDRTSLLAHINRCNRGIGLRDLLDAYDGVERDLNGLITAGDVLSIYNPEDKDKILFPRGEAFLIELDGIISIPGVTRGTNGGTIANGGLSAPTNGRSTVDDALVAAAVQRARMDAERKQQQKHPTDVMLLETDVDPRKQIRRGEAISVGGQWFRISSAIKEGPLSEQPARAQAPLSVVSLTDMSKRNEADGYIRPFSEKVISLDAAMSATALENMRKATEAREQLQRLSHGRGISGGAASQLVSSHAHASNPTALAAAFASTAAVGSSSVRKRPTTQKAGGHGGSSGPGGLGSHGGNGTNPIDQAKRDAQAAQEAASDPHLALYSHARRHGCTKDVRDTYLNTRSLVPGNDLDLHQLLLEHKLLEPGEAFRRPRLKRKANVDNDGKPKKRRYYERKNQRMTNTHLDGTEAGAVLRLALEKQKQGKSVGDGGM